MGGQSKWGIPELPTDRGRSAIRGVCLTGLCALFGCTSESPPTTPGPTASGSGTGSVASAALDTAVTDFCGGCHAVPQAISFPRSAWYDEVRRGYDFYFQSGRRDLKVPIQADVVAWYQQRAPESLGVPDQSEGDDPGLRFKPVPNLSPIGEPTESPAISFLETDTRPDGQMAIWMSDMRHGTVRMLQTDGSVVLTVTDAPHPAAVRRVDLDSNGIDDLLIADLGSFLPEDHDKGVVLWIPDGTSIQRRPAVPLLQGIGRVADIACGDLDGDGDLDIAVAEFGWHRTGGVHVLRQQSRPTADSPPQFEATRLDDRPGGIHVRIRDLNGDGLPDLLALISQEHEKIVVWLNRGETFEPTTIYAAPDPSWGSSGLELADMDGDGDDDILYTNGDTFDSYLIKPYHSIQLLRNHGDLRFEAETITALPGVHRALPADVDGDGDLDIVAGALLPERCLHGTDPSGLHAVIWLEYDGPGQYSRHVIQYGLPACAALAIADVDQDGRPDVLTGRFDETPSGLSPLRIYRNALSSR